MFGLCLVVNVFMNISFKKWIIWVQVGIVSFDDRNVLRRKGGVFQFKNIMI